jgi:GON domain
MQRSLPIPLVVVGLVAALAVAAPASASVSAPPSCAGVHAAHPTADDRTYTIVRGGIAFDVYCAGMASTPKEYINLQNTGGDFNFSQYQTRRPCGYPDIYYCAQIPWIARTQWTKVRLDPATLRVSTDDRTFGTHSGESSAQNNYANASDCWAFYSQVGRANVDLRGTPFEIDDTFTAKGFLPNGTAHTIDAQQVNLDGGGWCGEMSPSNSPTLQLKLRGTPDTTPPVITPTVTGTEGDDGFYTSDVNVSWSSDEPTIESEGCGTTTIDADTGGQTLTCAVASAGGVSEKSVTVKRDATPSTLDLGGGGTYTVADTIAITCGATDALSGVAQSNCASLAGSKPAHEYALGETTLTANATDRAGNVGTADATVTVEATPASVKSLVSSFSTNPGVADALTTKIESIAHASNGNSKAGMVQAFINQVNAQTGKALTEDQAATLISLVKAL